MASLADRIVSKYNSDDVIKFSDKDSFKEVKSWASLGSPELDENLGILGLPNGIIEIAGKSRSGKTTLALMGMKDFMDKNPDNGVAVILSSENRDNKEYAKNLGINVDNVIIYKIRTLEKMVYLMKNLIDNTKAIYKEDELPGEPKFYFFWDALGSTLSQAEVTAIEENVSRMEKKLIKGDDENFEAKNPQMMAFAKVGKQLGKIIISESYDTTMHFVMLNHYYDKTTGHGTKSTGGEWVELFPTIRLKTVLKEHVKVDDVQVAQITRVIVEKNDFGSRKETEIEILLGYGLVLSANDIAYGVEKKLITRESANKYSAIGGKVSWKSKREYYDLYKEGNKFMRILHRKVLKAKHNDIFVGKGYNLDEKE